MKKTVISTDERWKLVIEKNEPEFKVCPNPLIAIYKNDVASGDALHIDWEGIVSIRNFLNELTKDILKGGDIK